jgi:hypothetical protein
MLKRIGARNLFRIPGSGITLEQLWQIHHAVFNPQHFEPITLGSVE